MVFIFYPYKIFAFNVRLRAKLFVFNFNVMLSLRYGNLFHVIIMNVMLFSISLLFYDGNAKNMYIKIIAQKKLFIKFQR